MPHRPISALEAELRHDRHSLPDTLRDFYAGESTEFLSDVRHELNMNVLKNAMLLHAIYAGEGDDDSWRAAYGAFHFALEVDQMATGHVPRMDVAVMLDAYEQGYAGTVRDVIGQVAEAYFIRNTNVSELVGSFMHRIDTSGQHQLMSKDICGFIFAALDKPVSDESSEANRYTELEPDMYEDLNPWRNSMINAHHVLLEKAYQMFLTANGRDADLRAYTDRQAIADTLRDFYTFIWGDIDKAPQRGTLIQVTGEGILQPTELNEQTGQNDIAYKLTDPLTEIRGIVDNFDIQPYIDDAIFSVAEHDRVEASIAMERYFGLQLVLRDVIVTHPDDAEPTLYMTSPVYLPLHYPRMNIKTLNDQPNT